MVKASVIKVAVDLTPLRPGGENGGAKTLAITLLEEFSSIQADCFEYILITESWNHQELLSLQANNIICILKTDMFPASPLKNNPSKRSYKDKFVFVKRSKLLKTKLKGKIKLFLERYSIGGKRALRRFFFRFPRLESFLGHCLARLRHQFPWPRSPFNIFESSILRQKYKVDVLFCPFSAPTFAEPDLPLVAIAYDLQHLDLPFFFSDIERSHRSQFLADLLRKASFVVCISEFTRQSFFAHLNADAEKLTSIPICIHERLTKLPDAFVSATLNSLGLGSNQYLFFPANFWPHKNHRMLLAAYSIFRKKFPHLTLDLVFTGALEEPQRELKELVFKLGYDDNIHFLGFLRQEELTAIWQGSKGLIFPSLYEGFGIPLLEAMWFDKPIACSAMGSLPEVGEDAVIYFDPRKPESIADAIAALAKDDALTLRLRARAQQRLRGFSQRSMTEQYLNVLRAAAARTLPPSR